MQKRLIREFEAIAFDFDGTLADTERTHMAARIEAYRQLGDELGDERYAAISVRVHEAASLHGSHPESINAWIMRQAGIVSDAQDERVHAVVERKNQLYWEITARGMDEVPGAVRFVRKAAVRRPGKLAIVTTAHRQQEVMPFLMRHKLNRTFPDASIVAREDVEHLKPHPEGYERAAEILRVKSAERLLVIEDSPRGIESAKAAGALVVGIMTTRTAAELAGADVQHKPNAIARNYDELAEMVL